MKSKDAAMVVVEERGVRICAAYWYRISVGFRLKRRGIGTVQGRLHF